MSTVCHECPAIGHVLPSGIVDSLCFGSTVSDSQNYAPFTCAWRSYNDLVDTSKLEIDLPASRPLPLWDDQSVCSEA